MRRLLRLALWTLGIVVGLIVLLLLSIPLDGLIGRGRVEALTNTEIPNPNGPPVRAFVARPDTPGPHPAVIMIHEWWGLKPEIVGKAEALAREGYVVIAPDTFRGRSTGWIPRAIYQVSTSDAAQVAADLDAVYAWLAAQPEVMADKIAVMGFCYGGRTSLLYSVHNPQVAATAIFYGMADTTPEQLRVLQGPVLGIFGGADASIPLAEVEQLEANLASAGIATQVSVYPDQPHAFMRSIEETQMPGPQQEAWNELLAFLAANVKERTGSTFERSFIAQPQDVSTARGYLYHRFMCGL
jgi:carboxymethylenebutenolidase